MKNILEIGKIKWINYSSPSKQEIEFLVKEYDLHELVAEDLSDTHSQPKIDEYDNNIFLVLNFPKYNTKKDSYFLNEFNIIIGKDYIITLTTYPTNHIQKIIKEYKTDLADSDTQNEEAFKISPYYILYTIIDMMYEKTLRMEAQIAKDLIMLESDLTKQKKSSKYLLERLMKKKINLTYLKYIFLPQEPVLEELHQVTMKIYKGDLDVYFEDLETVLDKIINKAATLYENVQSLADTYNALMNIETNSIIRILTMFTAIMAVMTVITGFYGMNIELPGMNYPLVRIYIAVGMLILAGLIVVYFRKNKWL